MRIVFMGTPEFARTALDALVAAGHQVIAIYTQPPRRANRGRVTPAPVHVRGDELGIPVYTPVSLREEAEQKRFAALDADVAVVAAYGLLLPQAVLDAPRLGCINIHASLLPRWRGAAPVQRAILAGDTETGVTIMQMERGLDTGPMLAVRALPVGEQTSGELTGALARLGAELLLETLEKLDRTRAQPQPETGVTYAHKIDKAEARIDWQARAVDVLRLVRAMQPAPGAWFLVEGDRAKLIAAEIAGGAGAPGEILADGLIACGDGAIRPLKVQPAGKPVMAAADWWRGRRLAPGARVE